MLSQPQVTVPDWNEEITSDFFGQYAKTSDEQQSQIRNVLQNAATVTHGLPVVLQPFKWNIIIRCEESRDRNECAEQLPDDPQDPCNTEDQPQTGRTIPTRTIAYTLNKRGSANNAEIMFCPIYFGYPSLRAVMDSAASFDDIQVNDLTNYRNQGDYFLHELLHTDLAANSLNDSPNPHITDIHLPLRTSRLPMYGPKWTKILANYDNRLLKEEDQKDPFNVAGFYTQRNGKSPAIPASCKISSLLMCFRS
jgi:hypothetical protein